MRRPLLLLASAFVLSACGPKDETLWIEVTGPLSPVRITHNVTRASGAQEQESVLLTPNPRLLVPLEGVEVSATVEATDADSHYRVRVLRGATSPDTAAAALAEAEVRGQGAPATVKAAIQ